MTSESINEKVSSKEVLQYYQTKKVLEHYEEATRRIGLWKSEELVFRQAFSSEQGSLLELGCGTGRIAFSLWSLGYEKIWATDFSSKMIRSSLAINSVRRTGIHFEKQDARNMSFEDQSFHGIIFGFNGLMQIPGSQNRSQAMQEVFRLLKPDGKFVFTTHDRSMPKWKKFWINERKKWRRGLQDGALLEFGDRFEETPKGKLYIHVPEISEIRKALKQIGFVVEQDFLRSKIATESKLVNEYSDECRFWVARKPG
ncbi:MAG: class I SAM-dependent methyltransferase [Opitutales bacterium]